MPKGGARNRSGPPPDPNALRREKKSDGDWTILPGEGRKGKAPGWPLTDQTVREDELWKQFWKKPQATLWEKNHQLYEVALHVRCFAEAESAEAPTSLRTLVRQQADALLLTIPAMLSARVRIAEDEVKEKRQARPASTAARDRFKVVADGGA